MVVFLTNVSMPINVSRLRLIYSIALFNSLYGNSDAQESLCREEMEIAGNKSELQ